MGATLADPTHFQHDLERVFADGDKVVSESATKYTNLPSWFTPGIVLMSRRHRLPITSSGKLSRTRARENFVAGAYAAAA